MSLSSSSRWWWWWLRWQQWSTIEKIKNKPKKKKKKARTLELWLTSWIAFFVRVSGMVWFGFFFDKIQPYNQSSSSIFFVCIHNKLMMKMVFLLNINIQNIQTFKKDSRGKERKKHTKSMKESQKHRKKKFVAK